MMGIRGHSGLRPSSGFIISLHRKNVRHAEKRKEVLRIGLDYAWRPFVRMIGLFSFPGYKTGRRAIAFKKYFSREKPVGNFKLPTRLFERPPPPPIL